MGLLDIAARRAELFSIINIIMPSLYYCLKSHCLRQRRLASKNKLTFKNTASYRAFKRVQAYGQFAHFHIGLYLIYYFYVIIKYSLLVSLDLDFMSPYRWLDCYLLGRIHFVARVSTRTKYIGLLIALFMMSYRLMLLKGKLKFSFQCHEFILNGVERALEKEIISLDHENPSVTKGSASLERPISLDQSRYCSSLQPPDMGRYDVPRDELSSTGHLIRSQTQCKSSLPQTLPSHYDATYFATNYFNDASEDTRPYLRFNRSMVSWKILTVYVFCLGCIIYFYLSLLLIGFNRMLIPMMFGEIGFRLNYRYCCDWLIQEKLVHGREHRAIWPLSDNEYQVENLRVNISDIPLVMDTFDTPKASIYNVGRSLADLIENELMYFDFFVTFAMHTQNIFMMVFDTYINYKFIKNRLISLNHYLKHETDTRAKSPLIGRSHEDPSTYLIKLGHYKSPGWAASKESQATAGEIFARLREPVQVTLATYKAEVGRLQATLVDHFVLVQQYNNYVETNIVLAMSMWFVYTCLLCIWTSMVGLRNMALEFYAAFLLSFILIIVLLLAPAFIHACNYQLYSLISSSMALDTSADFTKLRWIYVLNYYFPAPLYCYSLFRSSRVSWLFCLKLYSWVITALLVATSFMDSIKISHNTNQTNADAR